MSPEPPLPVLAGSPAPPDDRRDPATRAALWLALAALIVPLLVLLVRLLVVVSGAAAGGDLGFAPAPTFRAAMGGHLLPALAAAGIAWPRRGGKRARRALFLAAAASVTVLANVLLP